MAEATNDLPLQVLRQVQTDLADMKKDMAEMKSDMRDVDQKVDGLTIMFAMLAGHVHHIEERVDALEARR